VEEKPFLVEKDERSVLYFAKNLVVADCDMLSRFEGYR